MIVGAGEEESSNWHVGSVRIWNGFGVLHETQPENEDLGCCFKNRVVLVPVSRVRSIEVFDDEDAWKTSVRDDHALLLEDIDHRKRRAISDFPEVR